MYHKFPHKNYDVISTTTKEYFEGKIKEARLRLNSAPLRWASAGALGVVTFMGRKWVILFYRDIHPKGWNIANGGSQDANEWHNIDWLANREFTEEIILIKECITQQTRNCSQVILEIHSHDRKWQEEATNLPMVSLN